MHLERKLKSFDRLIIIQVILIMPEIHRMKFLVANSSETELNRWITRLLTQLSSQPHDSEEIDDMEENKSELLYICEMCMKRLDSGAPKGHDTYFWSKDCIGLLQNIIRSALLLVNGALFKSALFIRPSKLPRKVFHDIGKRIDISKLDWYEKG